MDHGFAGAFNTALREVNPPRAIFHGHSSGQFQEALYSALSFKVGYWNIFCATTEKGEKKDCLVQLIKSFMALDDTTRRVWFEHLLDLGAIRRSKMLKFRNATRFNKNPDMSLEHVTDDMIKDYAEVRARPGALKLVQKAIKENQTANLVPDVLLEAENITGYGTKHCWTQEGRKVPRVDGSKLLTYKCASCRSKLENIKDKVYKTQQVPTRKLILKTNGEYWWADNGPDVEHVCTPMSDEEVKGTYELCHVLSQVHKGVASSSAQQNLTRLRTNLTLTYLPLGPETFKKVQAYAIPKIYNVSRAIMRSNSTKYPAVPAYDALHEKKYKQFWYTLRGFHSPKGTEYYKEQFLYYADQQLAIFSAPPLINALQQAHYVVSDGTFQSAPHGTYQVYRTFAYCFHKDSGNYFYIPVVTALFKNKSALSYKVYWNTIREELEKLNKSWKLKNAFFDCEVNAFREFQKCFPLKQSKMCDFHVNQAVYRRIQRLGLGLAYIQNNNIYVAVKQMVAMQFLPKHEFDTGKKLFEIGSIHWTQQKKKKGNYICCLPISDLDERINVDNFFSFYDLGKRAPRNTNGAESYHHKMRKEYSKAASLGVFVGTLQNLTNAEVERLEDYESSEMKSVPPGHTHAHYYTGQALYNAKQVYAASINSSATSDDHMAAVSTFLKSVAEALSLSVCRSKRLISDTGVELNVDKRQLMANRLKKLKRRSSSMSTIGLKLKSFAKYPAKKKKKNRRKRTSSVSIKIKNSDKFPAGGPKLWKRKTKARVKTKKSLQFPLTKKAYQELQMLADSNKKTNLKRKFLSCKPITNTKRRTLAKRHKLKLNKLLDNEEHESVVSHFSIANFRVKKVIEADSDKECLFRAISLALTKSEENYEKLRHLAVSYIRQETDMHKLQLEQNGSWNDGETHWTEIWKSEELNVKDTGTKAEAVDETHRYGSAIHLIALSKLLKIEILVYQSSSTVPLQLYTPQMMSTPSLDLSQDPSLPLIMLQLHESHFDLIEEIY